MFNVLHLLVERGIRVDRELSSYKNYKSLLGIKYGKWKRLPHCAYISVLKVRLKMFRKIDCFTSIKKGDQK